MNETYQYKMESLWENTEDSVNNMPNKYAKGIQFDTVNNILNTPKKTVNKFLTARMNPNLNGILSKEEGIKFENQQKQAIIDQDFQTFLQSLDQSKPENLKFLKEIKSYYKERGNYKKYTNAYEKYRDKLKKQKEMIKKNKEIKKMIPSFIDDLNNGKLIISETIPLKRSYLLNILETKKRINLWNSEHLSDEKSKLYNFIQEHPQRFLRMIKWFIPQDTEAINYLNELPKNKADWTNALQNWASELSQIFQNKDNQKKLAELTGLSQDELNDIRSLRAFLLTHQDIFDKIIKTFNYDDETKKITKGEKTKEKVLDTSNYTFRIMERYGIKEGKEDNETIDDGGTGLFTITNYYLKNKNNPQAQAFCKEYEKDILPLIEEALKNKNLNINNINNIKDQNDRKNYSEALTSVWNALNENNKTEALKKNKLTPESIKRWEELVNVFESTSKEPKTPQEKKTMKDVLQGEYFQEQLGNKMQQLMGNPKLSNFFAKHPNLRSFTLEDLAKFDGRDPAQKLLIQLVANTFVSKKALDSYQHNLIDTNKLDDVNAITETVDHVFEEALNDESLFKDFENNETDKTFEGIIDITGDEIQKDLSNLLDQFYKENNLNAINNYKKNAPDREEIRQNHIEDFIKKFAKKYEESSKKKNNNTTNESRGFEKLVQIDKQKDKKINPDNINFSRDNITIPLPDTEKQKIEKVRTERIKKETEKKAPYIQEKNTNLNKWILTNRITKTIQTLRADRFTKGLKVDVDNSWSIQIDENLNITLEGTYEGKPCKLYINADGEVQTSVYYDHSHEGTISFNNEDQLFTLFKLPSIEEERKIWLWIVKEELSQGQNANERNPREKVSQGLTEKTKVSLEGIEDFPRKKEVGLCLLKIKELTNIETDTLNQEDPKEEKQYQLLKDIEECLDTADKANNLKRLLSRFDNVQTQMNNGEKSIERNSKIFKMLFNKEDMRKQKENKNFEGNTYTLLLRHFMREEGGRKQLRINDMIEFAHSFLQGEGDSAIQETENKMLWNSTDSQYTLYKDTDLAKKIQKYGKNQGQKKQ